MLGNSIAVSRILYCTGESLQGEINSQINIRHVISCAGDFAGKSFILRKSDPRSVSTPLF